MKLLPLLLILSVGVKGQSKITYKHNYIDGWIKVTESAWVTVGMKGDTTWFTQTIEETDQDDPAVKPKYEFDGLGNRVVHDTVIKSVPAKLGKPTVSYSSFTTTDETFSEPMYSNHLIHDTFNFKSKPIVKYKAGKKVYKKGKTVYRDRIKYRVIKQKPVKKPKEPKYETIKFIDYKKNLYIVTTPDLYGEMPKVIEAKTKAKAIEIYRKYWKFVSSVKIVATQFTQYDIIK